MPEVIINGSEGRIEGRFTKSEDKNSPSVLILHPDPRCGGTMHNKVVHAVYQSFVRNGCSALKMNFRGVGKSEGVHDNGIGELADAAKALDWLQDQNPNASSFWIAGFSYGAWIAMQLAMRRPEIQGFVCVSPPVSRNEYDFSFLSPCPAPGLIIQGDQDSVVLEEAVFQFAEKLNKQCSLEIEYQVIKGADHFFRFHMDELTVVVDDYLKSKLSDSKPIRSKPDRRRRQLTDE